MNSTKLLEECRLKQARCDQLEQVQQSFIAMNLEQRESVARDSYGNCVAQRHNLARQEPRGSIGHDNSVPPSYHRNHEIPAYTSSLCNIGQSPSVSAQRRIVRGVTNQVFLSRSEGHLSKAPCHQATSHIAISGGDNSLTPHASQTQLAELLDKRPAAAHDLRTVADRALANGIYQRNYAFATPAVSSSSRAAPDHNAGMSSHSSDAHSRTSSAQTFIMHNSVGEDYVSRQLAGGADHQQSDASTAGLIDSVPHSAQPMIYDQSAMPNSRLRTDWAESLSKPMPHHDSAQQLSPLYRSNVGAMSSTGGSSLMRSLQIDAGLIAHD